MKNHAQHDSTHMCVEVAGYSHADDRMKQRDYSPTTRGQSWKLAKA